MGGDVGDRVTKVSDTNVASGTLDGYHADIAYETLQEDIP